MYSNIVKTMLNIQQELQNRVLLDITTTNSYIVNTYSFVHKLWVIDFHLIENKVKCNITIDTIAWTKPCTYVHVCIYLIICHYV